MLDSKTSSGPAGIARRRGSPLNAGIQNERSPAGTGLRESGNNFHVQNASAEPLLQRLDAVQKVGKGWRARCPACGGQSRKLSIAESDGRVLVHCFAGCTADDVVGAAGLR